MPSTWNLMAVAPSDHTKFIAEQATFPLYLTFASINLDTLTRSQPWPDGRKLDEGKVIGGKLVVARRDPTALFEFTSSSLGV